MHECPPATMLGLSQLLTPLLTGPETEWIESQLREIFGPEAAEPQDGSSLDDCLGQRRAGLLCMVPRSGSSFLSTLMRSTNRLGFTAEYLNLDAVAPLASHISRRPPGCGPLPTVVKDYHLGSLTEFLRHIIACSSSPNGIFSLKGDLYQYVPLLRRGLLRRGLQKATFIYITREDVLAQAVSAFRALRTGSWSVLQPARAQAEFDAEGILEQLQRIVRMMAQWETLFALLDVHPLRLTYEQISAQPAEAVHRVAAALGVSLGPGPLESPLRQQRDATSAEWAQRIRTAAAHYIKTLSAQRPGADPAAEAPPQSPPAPPGPRPGRPGPAWLRQWLRPA